MGEAYTSPEFVVLRAFWELRQAVDTGVESHLCRSAGMSMADFRILEELMTNGERRVSELADAVIWEKSRLSHHLGRMVRRGLVERIPDEDDKRVVIVRITPPGEQAFQDAWPELTSYLRANVLKNMLPGDLDWVLGLVDRIVPEHDRVRALVGHNESC